MHFKRYLILLIFLAEALIKDDEIRFHDDIPFIDITFSNGVKDSLVLKKSHPSKESQMERTTSCNFFGHLENESTACVSVTGCYGRDDLYFTINSKNSLKNNYYVMF